VYAASAIDAVYAASAIDAVYAASAIDAVYAASAIDAVYAASAIDALYAASAIDAVQMLPAVHSGLAQAQVGNLWLLQMKKSVSVPHAAPPPKQNKQVLCAMLAHSPRC
jgi:hypothetical protein